MKVYTAAQMRNAEQKAVDQGTTFEQLMENAGRAAAEDLLKRCPKPMNALIVCGKGNNGGDGLVIARIVQQHGWQVDIVFVLGNQLSELAELNRARLQGLERVFLTDWDKIKGRLKYDVVIDGVFGTGFSGKLPSHIAEINRVLNLSDGLKVALDMPTGLNGDTADAAENTFKADLTYAFGAYKPAHIQENAALWCGEIVCLDIGIE